MIQVEKKNLKKKRWKSQFSRLAMDTPGQAVETVNQGVPVRAGVAPFCRLSVAPPGPRAPPGGPRIDRKA